MKLPNQSSSIIRSTTGNIGNNNTNRAEIFPSAIRVFSFEFCYYVYPFRPFSDYRYLRCEPRLAWQTDDGQSGVIP